MLQVRDIVIEKIEKSMKAAFGDSYDEIRGEALQRSLIAYPIRGSDKCGESKMLLDGKKFGAAPEAVCFSAEEHGLYSLVILLHDFIGKTHVFVSSFSWSLECRPSFERQQDHRRDPDISRRRSAAKRGGDAEE